jgi:hypothetical protein
MAFFCSANCLGSGEKRKFARDLVAASLDAVYLPLKQA